MKKKLSLFLILYMIVNLSLITAAEESPDSTGTDKKKPKPVSITMFIPGIHQVKSGKFVKGTLLLGAFIGCITGTIIHNNNGNDWYKKYLDSTNVEEIIRLRQNTEKSFKKRNLFIIGILSVWALHAIDLKFSKTKSGTKKGSIKGEVGKNSFNIGFYYTF